MEEHFDVFKQSWIWAISVIAAIVSFRTIFDWSDVWYKTAVKFIAHLATSLFSALVAHELFRSWGLSQGLIFVGVALMAWQGSKGLEVMSNKVNDWIGVQKPDK